MKESPWSQGHVSVIRLLLKSGADPNAESWEIPWEIPWALFLRSTCEQKFDHNFTKALENSLFSEFLKYGAKRDMTIHLVLLDHYCLRTETGVPIRVDGSKMASTHFLMALFRYRNSHLLLGERMHALEDFYSGDIEHSKLQAAEALPLLRYQLAELATNPPAPGRLRFFAQVIQKLIPKWRQGGSDLKMLVPNILKAFPATTGAMLSNMINNPGNASPCRPRRSPYEETTQQPGTKRVPKQETYATWTLSKIRMLMRRFVLVWPSLREMLRISLPSS
jgi:hypothetical protein